MGEILEMSMRKHVTAMQRGALALLALVFLASCGNDPNAGVNSRAIFDLGKKVTALIAARAGAGAPDAEAAAGPPPDPVKVALAATDGKVMLVVVENTTSLAVLGVAQINGEYETWETSTREALTFKHGVLVATRGLGDDLMAARADAVIALITARREGRARRDYQFLTGKGETNNLTVECQVLLGGSERVKIGEIDVQTRSIAEICTNGSLEIKNLYWVDGQGRVIKSRQWVSAGIGYLAVQNLRL